MSKELAIKEYLKSGNVMKKFIEALPKKRDPNKYITGVMVAIALDTSGKLMACTNQSILKCCLTAIQLGIDIDAKGHGYLVPYAKEASFQIGYKFYAFKIQNHKDVSLFCTEVVYEGDTFSIVKGTNPELAHVPDLTNKNQGDSTKITFAYCIIGRTSGVKTTEVMTIKELMKIKAKSKSGIWSDNMGEMCKKTVCKRAGKWAQLPDMEDLTEFEETQDKMIFDNGKVPDVFGDDEVIEIKPEKEKDNSPTKEAPKADTKVDPKKGKKNKKTSDTSLEKDVDDGKLF